MKRSFPACCLLLGIMIFPACSFDYGELSPDNGDQPDIVMQDVEYVRMRDGYPVVRFTAEEAQRFEKKQSMELDHFKFEQFETHADNVNATGSAVVASIELDSGNIHMKGGVYIEVESEDLAIATATLEWQDKERQLSTGETEQVNITRSDGTSFTGWGFSADARRRSWEFKNGVEGTYVEKDDEEESENSAGTDESGDSGEDADAAGVPAAREGLEAPGAAENAGAGTAALPVQAVPPSPATRAAPAARSEPPAQAVPASPARAAPPPPPARTAPAARADSPAQAAPASPARAAPSPPSAQAAPASPARVVPPPPPAQAAPAARAEPPAPAVPGKTGQEKKAEEDYQGNLPAAPGGAK